MRVYPVELTIRGERVTFTRPGHDAPAEVHFVNKVDMVILALLQLEDPRVDEVLRAFGYQLVHVEGGQARVIFPEEDRGKAIEVFEEPSEE